MSSLEIRRLRKSQGLCVLCGAVPIEGTTNCDPCRLKRLRWLDLRRAAGICVQCGKPSRKNRRLCQPCNDARKSYLVEANRRTIKYRNDWRKADAPKIRAAVLKAYGDKCQCCGETRPEFLTIDHINNDGWSDKRCRTRSGIRITGYHWNRKIINLGFPADLQLLCWNCNQAKRIYGQCPHRAG